MSSYNCNNLAQDMGQGFWHIRLCDDGPSGDIGRVTDATHLRGVLPQSGKAPAGPPPLQALNINYFPAKATGSTSTFNSTFLLDSKRDSTS